MESDRLMLPQTRQSCIKSILRTFVDLPEGYQQRIKLLAELTHKVWSQIYLSMIRKIIERRETPNDLRNIEATAGSRREFVTADRENDLPTYLPAYYFDPIRLWEKYRPVTVNVAEFRRFYESHLHSQIANDFRLHTLKQMPEEGIQDLLKIADVLEVPVLPDVFPVQKTIVAPIKYPDERFEEVELFIQQGVPVGEALNRVFDANYHESNGYSREGFGKRFYAYLRKNYMIR